MAPAGACAPALAAQARLAILLIARSPVAARHACCSQALQHMPAAQSAGQQAHSTLPAALLCVQTNGSFLLTHWACMQCK